MEFTHDIAINHSPILGRPRAMVYHRSAEGDPAPQPEIISPQLISQIRADFIDLSNQVQLLRNEIALLRRPWWEKLLEWFRRI